VRAIRGGKHVLVEKPSTSNATEAGIPFLEDFVIGCANIRDVVLFGGC
jgi:hypothetical protein